MPPLPGDMCQPDPRKSGVRPAHPIQAPDLDEDLQAVHQWMSSEAIVDHIRSAADDAIRYVLDGSRTWRFDLTSPKVDSDERSSVGTKLQYHVIERLGLEKQPPLDTVIDGVAVEIKGTVRNTWMIPREGQCEITLLIQIDAKGHRFRALLMRTHRAWLTGGKGNQDLKRSPIAQAVRDFALEVAPWTDLPHEPLRLLNPEQLPVVFGKQGLAKRYSALFGYLPEVVIPRASLETVGAKLDDPLRRARAAKEHILKDHGSVVLVGRWPQEREVAGRLGHNLGDSAWVAVPAEKLAELGHSPTDFVH